MVLNCGSIREFRKTVRCVQDRGKPAGGYQLTSLGWPVNIALMDSLPGFPSVQNILARRPSGVGNAMDSSQRILELDSNAALTILLS